MQQGRYIRVQSLESIPAISDSVDGLGFVVKQEGIYLKIQPLAVNYPYLLLRFAGDVTHSNCLRYVDGCASSKLKILNEEGALLRSIHAVIVKSSQEAVLDTF